MIYDRQYCPLHMAFAFDNISVAKHRQHMNELDNKQHTNDLRHLQQSDMTTCTCKFMKKASKLPQELNLTYQSCNHGPSLSSKPSDQKLLLKLSMLLMCFVYLPSLCEFAKSSCPIAVGWQACGPIDVRVFCIGRYCLNLRVSGLFQANKQKAFENTIILN